MLEDLIHEIYEEKRGLIITPRIMNGLVRVINQINSDTEEGGGKELYDKALKSLGLEVDKPKELPKPSKSKKVKTILPITEQVAVEMALKKRLSQKYTVK